MVTAEALARRRDEIPGSEDLRRLVAHLTERARPVLAQRPSVPDTKALLSRDGGVCPRDGASLAFDPWSPHAHRCPRCGESYTGERHDGYWARFQHLWLAERAAHLATLAALETAVAGAAARAQEILTVYGERYLRYPNRDNVLGPSRLFFSTYLESIWLCNYLAAAHLLQEAGLLEEATRRAVTQVADEAANLIGEFDEWFSNRQTWNNAALVAIAVWFEDEDLARRAIEGQSGLIAHVARGFGRDGMWYEGENYHLFALRGLLTGVGWARQAGADLLTEAPVVERMRAALRAPAVTALPDLTYPARKDSRFGVSLAQPAHLEVWEVGIACLGSEELSRWLSALYRAPAVGPELMESYLHDAPLDAAPHPPARDRLSWWALLEMLPELPRDTAAWAPASELLSSQGLALLRSPRRYLSLECGGTGGGHGHEDRLNLTLHADGVHWLPDVGTGSYVSPDLLWYRSALAHNAPRLDGRPQQAADAVAEAFEERGEWAWARGRHGDVTRAVVSSPAYVLDVVDLATRDEHLLELPWHFAGDVTVGTPGRWEPAELAGEFVTGAERFVPDAAKAPLVLAVAANGRTLRVQCQLDGELLRAMGPGRPGSGKRDTFYVTRARGRVARLVTVLEVAADAPLVRAVRVQGNVIEVETTRGVDRHTDFGASWNVDGPGGSVRLGGRRSPEAPFRAVIEIDAPTKARGSALRIDAAPALDGSPDGFDTSEPLALDVEDQYRRSEEAYPGPDDCSALAFVNWTDEHLYLAVEVTKPDVCFRAPDAPPLNLDNEPDDVNSDGLQLYLAEEKEAGFWGFLVVPEEGKRGGGPLRVRAVAGTEGRVEAVRGAWVRTEHGYRVTLAVAWPDPFRAHPGAALGFDLLVNEMLPGRVRRAGQLVWSGGNGWVWLRGDRQPRVRLGVLELVG